MSPKSRQHFPKDYKTFSAMEITLNPPVVFIITQGLVTQIFFSSLSLGLIAIFVQQ